VQDTTETTETASAGSSQSTEQRKVDYDLQGAPKRLMDKCVKDASNNTARLDRDRQDWLNLLFDRGGAEHQYVIWDAGTNRWVTRGSDPKKGGLPDWMPRPVTNLYSNKLDGIASLLNQSEGAQLWKPNTEDDEDLATAEVCDAAVPVLRDEIDYDQLRTDINRQICLTDKVALILYYDNDEKYGTAPILALQCLDEQCGEYALPMDQPEDAPETCQACGGPMDVALDPRTQEPIGVDYPVGRMCATFHPSFEFSLPRSARSHRADKNPWVLFHARYSWEDAASEFPDHIDKLKDKSGWKSSSIQRQYADAARRLSSPRSSAVNAGSDGSQHDGPLLFRLYHDPIDDGEFYFPEGLMTVMLNDQLIEAKPLSFKQSLPNGHVKHFKNVLIRTFRSTPGSQFGKPPADDLVPLQYTRNLLEALLLSILLHHASPRTFLPLSVTLEKPITGVPGEVIPFRSTVPGETPTTTQGQNPPDGLYKWIEQIDAKFDELSKLNSVLQGERPSGDPTLGEIQILKEQGQSAFSEPMLEAVRWEKALSRMLLWIARDTLWTERLRQIQGSNREWDFTEFTAADLSGNVDVDVDPASAWPKSALMERATLKELLGMGVFQLMKQDPELATQILEKYGMTEFLPSLDKDRRQVMRELDRWRAATDPAAITPPDPVTQNLSIHQQHKLDFLKTEEAEALARENPTLHAAMKAHLQQIQQLLQASAGPKAEPPKTNFSMKGDLADPAARMLFEKANGLPATPAPMPVDPNAGPDGAALNDALSGGALKPAGASGMGLNAAVSGGLLQPAGAAQAAAQASGPSIDDLVTSGALLPAASDKPRKEATSFV